MHVRKPALISSSPPDAPLSKTKLNYLPSPRVTESNKWNRGMPEESLTKLLSPLIELRDPFPDSPPLLSFFYIDISLQKISPFIPQRCFKIIHLLRYHGKFMRLIIYIYIKSRRSFDDQFNYHRIILSYNLVPIFRK